MIATDYRNNGGGQNSDRILYQGGKSNKKRQQDRRDGRQQGQSNGKPVTECGYCNLIKGKDVSQDNAQRNINKIHNRVSDKAL